MASRHLNVIEVGDLAQDPGDETRGLLGGFEELAPDMVVAAHELDPWLVLRPGGIGAVAVALDDVDELPGGLVG